MISFLTSADNLYLPIYKIGHGASGSVHFCVEFDDILQNITMKKVVTYPKVIKIFRKKGMSEFEKEKKIGEILRVDGIGCEFINYPVGIIENDEIDAIVYNACACSLQKLCDMFDSDFKKEIQDRIITQMREGLEFMHNCEYIHSDIKMDNFLVNGLNPKQKAIMDFCKKYKYKKLFKVNVLDNDSQGQFVETINEIQQDIRNFVETYNTKNEVYDFSSDSSEEEYEDSLKSNSFSEEECSDANKEKSEKISSEYSLNSEEIDSDCSSFISYKKEFFKKYDKFHTKEIMDLLEKNQKTNSEEKIEKPKKYVEYEKAYYMKEILPKIHILLTDFGLIRHKVLNQTAQYVNFRCPENALGIPTSYENDIWALNMMIHEFLHKSLKFDIHKHPYYGFCENNLLVLYNTGFSEYIKKSPFNEIYTNEWSLKFL